MPRLRGKSCQQRAQIPREGVVDEQDAHGSSRGCCQKAGRPSDRPAVYARLTVAVFQGKDLLLYGLAGRIAGLHRCQTGFQRQAAIGFGPAVEIIAAIILLRPAVIQLECLFSGLVDPQRDAVPVGQIIDAGQAQGILALQQHLDAADERLVAAGIAQQPVQRQARIVRDMKSMPLPPLTR